LRSTPLPLPPPSVQKENPFFRPTVLVFFSETAFRKAGFFFMPNGSQPLFLFPGGTIGFLSLTCVFFFFCYDPSPIFGGFFMVVSLVAFSFPRLRSSPPPFSFFPDFFVCWRVSNNACACFFLFQNSAYIRPAFPCPLSVTLKHSLLSEKLFSALCPSFFARLIAKLFSTLLWLLCFSPPNLSRFHQFPTTACPLCLDGLTDFSTLLLGLFYLLKRYFFIFPAPFFFSFVF